MSFQTRSEGGEGNFSLRQKASPRPLKLPHSPQNALIKNPERHAEERYSTRLPCSMDLPAASGVRTKKDKGTGTPAAYAKRDRGCRSVQACECTGCVVVERQTFRTARRRCRLRADARPYGGAERDGDPLVLPHIGRATGMHTERRAPEGQQAALQEDALLPCQATPQNAKRPPCGGPCILFPRPAGAGHGHRNYSALSALAGASVLASGRRVSSMMAMGALSPLRGMASFITRV